MKRLAPARLVAAGLGAVCLAAGTARAGSPLAREQSELLARAGEARYRLALLRPGAGDLSEALRALEESRDLDPANLRALAYLGLARLEAAGRGAAAGPDASAFATAREPLDEIFRLSGGWSDPQTRRLLADLSSALDQALEGERAVPDEARAWWRAWRERLRPAERSAPTAGEVLAIVEALRGAPFGWERERAAEELAGRAPLPPEAVQALAEALREDASPWVRAAAARSLAELRSGGWDVRLAEALRNDEAVWVRRTCAEALASGGVSAARAARSALIAALETDTPRVAAAAAMSLGRTGGAERELVAAVESPSSLVRDSAATALLIHSDAGAIAAKLRPLMDSGRAEVRAAALRAVGPGPGHLPDEMTEKVALLLGDPDARVRAAAARALFCRDVRGAVPKLRGLLSDEDLIVRLDAADTLLAAGVEAARPVLEDLSKSRAPLTTFPNRSDVKTVGDAARWILAERGKERQTPPVDGE